jgi:uncharacterized protein (DUF4415 family)
MINQKNRPMKRWTKVVQVKIADDQYEALITLADEQQTTINQILRSAIAELVREKSLKSLAKKDCA